MGVGLWIAAERLPLARAVHPQAATAPPIQVPAAFAREQWSRENALRELVRGRWKGSPGDRGGAGGDPRRARR